MPYDRKKYPANWPALARACKEAADWRCEACGTQCRRPGEPHVTHKLTLTAAHLDHDEANPSPRLMAMCAPCHLR